MKPVVQARGLGRRHDGRPVFTGLDLDLAPGELVCLVGPSGCGKTTLLHTLAGLAPPDEGRLTVRAARLGVAFQDHGLCPWWDLAENLRLVLRPLGLTRNERERRIRKALDAVGLAGLEKRLPEALSGGQRQRAALARVLAVEADLWLLDEPFAHLDFQTRLHLQDLLAHLLQARSRSALLVTHDLEEALRLGDRVLVMKGRPAGLVDEVSIHTPRPRPYARLHRDPRLAAPLERLAAQILDERTTG